MITQDEARSRASAWYETAPDSVGMQEFDLGWVVWELPPATDDPARLPDFVGSARGVVDRADGTLTRWPSLPASVIADQYRDWHAARGRFPADVEEALARSGWRPGRHVGDHAWGWLTDLIGTLDDDAAGDVDRDRHGPVLHEAAKAVVDEFGRLMIVQRPEDQDVRRLLRFYPLAFDALPDRDWRPAADTAARLVESGATGPVCPVGVYQVGTDLGEVAVGADGGVYLSYGADGFLLGGDVDEALGAFLAAAPVVRLEGGPSEGLQPDPVPLPSAGH